MPRLLFACLALSGALLAGCSPDGENDSHDIVERNSEKLQNTTADQPSEQQLPPGDR